MRGCWRDSVGRFVPYSAFRLIARERSRVQECEAVTFELCQEQLNHNNNPRMNHGEICPPLQERIVSDSGIEGSASNPKTLNQKS